MRCFFLDMKFFDSWCLTKSPATDASKVIDLFNKLALISLNEIAQFSDGMTKRKITVIRTYIHRDTCTYKEKKINCTNTEKNKKEKKIKNVQIISNILIITMITIEQQILSLLRIHY